jgi:hypothetical protein
VERDDSEGESDGGVGLSEGWDEWVYEHSALHSGAG